MRRAANGTVSRRTRGRDTKMKVPALIFFGVIPCHVVVFYGMMNYHEPGSPTSCRSLGQKATLVIDECQARALFYRKDAAIKPGSRLMPQAAFHRQRVRGRDDPEKNRGRQFHFVISTFSEKIEFSKSLPPLSAFL